MASRWARSAGILIILIHVRSYAVQGRQTNLKEKDLAFHDYERHLHEKLRKDYNAHVLPQHNKSSPVRVAIELSVIGIQELKDVWGEEIKILETKFGPPPSKLANFLSEKWAVSQSHTNNERTESLTVDAWLKMQWNDSRLLWKREDYGDLTTTRLPHHLIWHPDIRLLNRVKLSEIETQADVFCVVHNTGEVEWVVPSTFHSSCSIDLKFYPFDIQTCQLIFGSWNLNGYHIDMDLVQQKNKIQFHHFFNTNNQWDVAGSHVQTSLKYFPCCEEPFPDVTFEIQLRRRSPYYKQTILYPTFGVAALTLATFWLPPQSKDKIVLGGINFFVLVIILTHLSWKLPPAGKTFPMIVAFCGHLVIIVISSIILSVIFIVYGRSQYKRPPPRWLRAILNSMVGKILCVNQSTTIEFSSKNHVDDPSMIELDLDDIKNGPSELERQEYFTSQWLQGLQMLDRILFVVFLIIIAFSLAGSFTFNQ